MDKGYFYYGERNGARNNSFNRSGISFSFIENPEALRRFLPPGQVGP
jgi:hypothetical protein